MNAQEYLEHWRQGEARASDGLKAMVALGELLGGRPLILTVAEIRDLAEFAGVMQHGVPLPLDADELETEIVIGDCPKQGIDNDGEVEHYRHMAWYYEYPEEGVFPLGEKVPPNNEVAGSSGQ